ncbi:EAL domain-containing protein [Methylomonas sp. AM2-LC]|uniref:bifunctional diguanylate cyclase/phosphodiesterase n=1 Tax=Methylomonas sp. AM2-LC TaxID=3153301 RepID=UPI003265C83E
MLTMFYFLPISPDESHLYQGYYNFWLVAVSVLLAFVSAYAALNAASRIAQQDIFSKLMWLAICMLTLGIGVWSMHFIGMLALNLPCTVHYDMPLTFLSMLPSILVSGLALVSLGQQGSKRLPPIIASSFLGIGIAMMHFTGMAAMQLEGFVGYNPYLFAVAVFVAIALSYLLLRTIATQTDCKSRNNALLALVLATAVSGMHYIAMSAAYFIPAEIVPDPTTNLGFNTQTLAVVVILTTVILGLSTLIAATFSRNLETTRQLRVSEERLKIATTSGQIGIWDLDLQTLKLVWDDTMFSLYGVRREDDSDAYQIWLSRLHPADKSQAQAVLKAAIADKKEYQPEFRVIWPDGTLRHLKGHAHLVKDSLGNPLRLIGTLWNNNDYVLSQHQLKLASAAMNKSNSPFFWINNHAQVIDINDSACSSLGYSRAEIINQPIWFFDPMITPESWTEHWEKLKKGLTYTFESIHQRQDGSVFPVEITTNYIVDEGEEFCFSFSHDLTERKQADMHMRIAATAFEAQEAMVISDTKSIILQVNNAFIASTGYTAAELVGQKISILNSDSYDEAFYQSIWQCVAINGRWQGEICGQRKNGESYPKWLTITAVTSNDGQITHYVATHEDITQRKVAEEEIKHLAFYDALTDLPNRRLMLERLKHCIDVDRRENKQLALLMLDLDRFKAVNDHLGHLAGDDLLQQVAGRITSRLREIDLVARLGGDEFLILLDNIIHPDDAARVAKEIVADLSKPFQLLQSDDVRIGASIGISLYPQHGDNPEVLMDHADTALYRAKDQGRGCFAYFSEQLTLSVREHIELETRLRRAIQQQELCLYYQPKVDICTGRIIGAEALLRWQDPDEGLILPSRFIPIAEETSLIVELGEWVLREACQQGQKWLAMGLSPVSLAVNLSPYQFKRSDICAMVAKVLKETEFPPQQLELEITESGLMDNHEEKVYILNWLHTLGIRIAVDDFGTGYSSLAYLKRFSLDVLKIDKSFIDEIPNNVDAMEIAATIVAMGHTLGMKVLAEGVETQEQLAFLQEKGCDMYQGLLKSRPLPSEKFAELLCNQHLVGLMLGDAFN